MTPEQRAADVVEKQVERTGGQQSYYLVADRVIMTTAIQEAIQEAIAEEREACAKAVEVFKAGGMDSEVMNWWGQCLAGIVRGRSSKEADCF